MKEAAEVTLTLAGSQFILEGTRPALVSASKYTMGRGVTLVPSVSSPLPPLFSTHPPLPLRWCQIPPNCLHLWSTIPPSSPDSSAFLIRLPLIALQWQPFIPRMFL